MKSTEVRSKILELLPIRQDFVWKNLGIEHRQVSRVVLKMIGDKLIVRTGIKIGTVYTYMLESYLNKTDDLKRKILTMLPIQQDEVWKELCLDHTYISRIVREMEDDNLLTRTPIQLSGARKTFLLEKREVNKNEVARKKKEKENRFIPLLSGEVFSPCTGCSDDCDAATCRKLLMWIIG